MTPRGQWDITDLVVNDKYINVKSIKGNLRFLLVETKRYNADGSYCYKNNDGDKVRVDSYALVRIMIEPEMGPDDMNYENISQFWNSKGGRRVSAEILGGITHNTFWNEKHYAPRRMWCTVKNLEKLCQGKPFDMATEEEMNDKRLKTKILQRSNYILDGKTELIKIEELI